MLLLGLVTMQGGLVKTSLYSCVINMIKNSKDGEVECAKNTEQEEITLNILDEIHPDKNL